MKFSPRSTLWSSFTRDEGGEEEFRKQCLVKLHKPFCQGNFKKTNLEATSTKLFCIAMVGSSTSSYTFIYSTGLFTRNIVTVKIGLNFFVQCLLSYKDINPHLDTSAKRFGYIIVRFKDGSSCQLEDFQTLHKLFCSVSSTEDGRKKQKISRSTYCNFLPLQPKIPTHAIFLLNGKQAL